MVIANPVAGAGLAERLRPRLEDDLRSAGYGIRYVETRARGDAEAEARSASGAAAVVVIGGDGTVNEVLNGLAVPDGPPLAVVPAGTANVLAKELGLPRPVAAVERAGEFLARILSASAWRPERMASPARWETERVSWIAPALVAGREERIDIGTANGRRFSCMAGAGFDARVVRVLENARRGPISMTGYFAWALKAIAEYVPPRIRVTVDGAELANDASFVIAASTASYGGALTFSDTAEPDDGLLDVVAFRGRGLDDLVRWLAAAWLGRAAEDGLCRCVRGREIRMESDAEVDVQVDGDTAGRLPLTCAVRERALRVLMPGNP